MANVNYGTTVAPPKGASGFGIAALVLAIIGLLICWVPFLGVLAIPLGVIAVLVGGIGFIVSLAGGRSGVGLPVAGIVLGVVTIVVPIVITGAFAKKTADAMVEANQRERATNQQAGGGVTPASEWADATKGSVRQGEVEVSVSSARVGIVQLEQFGTPQTSKDQMIMITLQIANRSSATKLNYEGWAGHDFSINRDYATLVDEHGNVYKRMSFGGGTKVQGQVEQESIYPGKSLTDVLIFEPPVPAAKKLRLELPAKNFGGTGMLRLEIPVSMVKR